jgi:FkbM family methyltransferase
MLKRLIRQILRRRGYHIYASHQLPVGFSWILDVQRLAHPGTIRTIFDVGANEGQTAILLAHRFPQSRIHSFEPLLATFAALEARTRHLTNVHCHNYALGNQAGSVTVHPKAISAHNSLLPEINEAGLSTGEGETVQVRSTDETISNLDIDGLNLLKTDTEGFDLQVLTGATNALKAQRVDMIVSEVGFQVQDRQHTSYSQLKEFLETFGYLLYGIYDQNHELGRLHYADALFVSEKIRQSCPPEYASTYICHAE